MSMLKRPEIGNIMVAAGPNYTVGLKSDGTLVAVGQNTYGQCNVSSWENISAIAAGYYHTLGLRAEGTVVATGQNTYGQCDVSEWNLIVAKDYSTGDINSDGQINIFDIMAVVDHILGRAFLDGGALLAADVNKDGQINIFDIMAMVDHIFGKALIEAYN